MSANPIEAPLDAEATSPVLTVLIVEDDADVRLGCEQALRLEGIATRAVGSAEAALREVDAATPGIVVSDINLPGSDGMALLRELASRDAALPVIMITGHGDITLAVQAMKQGAYDFIEKPFSPERLVATCRALEKRRLALEVADLRARLAGQESLSARLIGHSPAIERLRQMIAGLGNTAATC
jgi:two-component system C4-dicarboxylate transport response regulator DctD